MEIGDFAAWAGIVISLIISLVTLRGAKRQEQIASEANVANQAQLEATQRRAVAVEESLAEALRLLSQSQSGSQAALPSPAPPPRPGAVRWTLERRGKHAYLLRNTGTATATGVRVDRNRTAPIVRNLPENATVKPGESVQFLMAPTFGAPLPGEVWVEWDGHPEQAIPIP
ncbi:hypothetical protein [Streptomyces goshikiensis]|uniref:hypothetical protein n=1 Tax=Streptomyces goshikiensis TaxID=1942 RepID=UPI0036A503F7